MTSLAQAITELYSYSLSIAGLGVFLMMLYAGFKFMFGDRKQGIAIILDAAVGLVLLFSAYVILNSINPDLVNLRDPVPPITNN